MSVNLMSAIFETEFRDLKDGDGNVTKASTAKLVLLAMADHANDEGEGAYPSVERLCRKTALSEQTIRNVFDALKYNGIISLAGKSKYGTNNHTINTKSFPKAIGKEVAYLTLYPLGGLTDGLGGSNGSLSTPLPVIPEPSLTKQETSFGTDVPLTVENAIALDAPIETVSREDDFALKANDAANLLDMGCQGGGNLALAFMLSRRILIPPAKIKGNRKAAREMLEMGVKPEHVRQAVESLTAKGMTVTDLFSVSKTAIDLANKNTTKTEDRTSLLRTL